MIIKSGYTYCKQALNAADIVHFHDGPLILLICIKVLTFEYARDDHGFIRDEVEITRKFTMCNKPCWRDI